jgi:hypothetical protein
MSAGWSCSWSCCGLLLVVQLVSLDPLHSYEIPEVVPTISALETEAGKDCLLK